MLPWELRELPSEKHAELCALYDLHGLRESHIAAMQKNHCSKKDDDDSTPNPPNRLAFT